MINSVVLEDSFLDPTFDLKTFIEQKQKPETHIHLFCRFDTYTLVL